MTGATVAAGWIALRYLRTRRREFGTFITRVSVAGLTLGVLVLTVVVSVMNGFDAELKQRILGTVPHLVLPGRSVDEVAVEALAEEPGVSAVYNFFVGAGMVTVKGAVTPVTLYGLDESAFGSIPTISENLIYGSLSELMETPRGLLLGRQLAAYLGVLPGDSVVLVVSEPDAAGVRPRILRFELSGIFEIGAELDYTLAVVPLPALEAEGFAGTGVRGVRVTLADPLAVPGFADKLRVAQPHWETITWAESYGELFQAVRMEKMLMFLILLMVVAVAAFNIVSGQSMAVTDKRADIAILSTMGASRALVLQIFLLQGLVISSLGILVGLVSGVVVARYIGGLISGVETLLGFRLLEGTYFVQIPSVVQGADLLFIALLSWSLCLISAYIPARRAANLNPIDGLHS